MKHDRIALLPGDGIGPEVTAVARRALEAVSARDSFTLTFDSAPVGGIAIDQEGDPLPPATLELAREADAVFLGAVGGPKWSDPAAKLRPEAGLLRLRSELGLFANLRPVRISPALIDRAPIKGDRLRGTDLLFVRELTGGLYFGARQEQGEDPDRPDHAFDTMAYSTGEVERVAAVAFRAAARRRGLVASIDKANVLASMRLWRQTVTQVAATHPQVALEHVLVDAAAMRLLSAPSSFDVVLAPNLFGDILSDEASVLAGSLGMLPSASLGSGGLGNRTPGLYEPVHGSAPDIAGQGKANPIAALLSAAMLLRHSLDRDTSATRIEQAVEQTLEDGLRTPDLAAPGEPTVGTEEMADAVLTQIESD